MHDSERDQQAFVLRIAPSRIDRVPEALESNEIIIGWANAKGLLNENLNWVAFRQILYDEYHLGDNTYRRAGAASGHMWRFIRDMKLGDLVVVPYGSDFYVAEVTGSARYVEAKVGDDTAYRREVKWLNDKKPTPRALARAALQSRMKTQGTSAEATDLIAQIEEVVELASREEEPTFSTDLHQRMVFQVLEEIRTGRLDSYKFEYLIRLILEGLGGRSVQIIPRQRDKGADLVATFLVAGAIPIKIAVQAKHYYRIDEPVGEDVVYQLLNGMEAEAADLGLIVTAGIIASEAEALQQQLYEESGVRIEFVDGEQLATLIIENDLLKLLTI